MNNFRYRIAQLDVARQMENPQFIRRFIDLLAANGYNMLMLYLEDRIITPSYPYPRPEEGYSVEEMRELVAYGAAHGVELFPCVATLGHAERFLRHPELAELSEMRGGIAGRLGPGRADAFCVSQSEFYDFLFNYLQEVAAIFPSPFFHVGLDEFFNFNLCPKCRAAAPDFAAEEQLFLRHIVKLNDFLHTLGKRLVMWSDMFELYGDILSAVPRDVILVDWQYQMDVRYDLGHFDNLSCRDNLQTFTQLGFEVWIAPHDMKLENPHSFIEYAQNYAGVTGAIITSWEKSDAYGLRYFPVVAVAGRLLQGMARPEAVRTAVKALLGIDDPRLARLIETAIAQEFIRHFNSSSVGAWFSRHHLGLNLAAHPVNVLIYEELQHYQSVITQNSDVVADLIAVYEEKILSFELKKRYLQALDFGLTPELRAEIVHFHQEYLCHFEKLQREWSIVRSGIVPNIFDAKLPMLHQRLTAYLHQLDEETFVKLRLMHSDWYGMPRLAIELQLDGQWQTVRAAQVIKPDDLTQQLTEYFIPCSRAGVNATAIRLTYTGLGGLGIAYCEVRQHGQPIRVPERVLDTQNAVYKPENILSNDATWGFFGEQSIAANYRIPHKLLTPHQVTISLKSC